MADKFRNRYRIPSARLQTHDYASTGYYFITICTKDRENLLGEIANNQIILTKIGEIAKSFWLEIPKHFPFVKLDEFQIMPNHLHGIIMIDNPHPVETRHCLVSTNHIDRFQNQGKQTISSIVGSFKSICTKTINKIQNVFILPGRQGFMTTLSETRHR